MKRYRTFFVKTLMALSCSVMFFASCREKEDVSQSTACDILTFKMGETAWNINGTDITYVYPSAILPTPLTPAITVSPGATVNPPTGEEQNNFFKDGGVKYIVTAEDRVTTKTYTARAVRTQYTGCEILTFIAGGIEWEINDSVITYSFPPGTDVTNFAPTVTMSPGARIRPLTSEAQNFFTDRGVQYTVTSEDGNAVKIYTVKSRIMSDECDIKSFSVDGIPWNMTGTSITYVFPSSTVEGPLTPTIDLSEGATVDPPSGSTQNLFTAEGVQYTVTAEDTAVKQIYTVRAIKAATNCDILTFYAGEAEWDINNDDLLITHTFPVGTVASRLTPSITLSPLATINPPANAAQNFFTDQGVQYTVTAHDGETKTYTAKAKILIKYDRTNWVAMAKTQHDWGDGKGSQDMWSGGHPMLTLDDDPGSGWHAATWNPLPQVLVIDMKASRNVYKVIATGDYFNNIEIYLTDDLSINGYYDAPLPPNSWDPDKTYRDEDYNNWANPRKGQIPETAPASWNEPAVQGLAESRYSFSFTLPENSDGQFLIIRFPDNTEDTNPYISVSSIEVYGK
jgi:hypothetical protein